jgi:hypothetical protein
MYGLMSVTTPITCCLIPVSRPDQDADGHHVEDERIDKRVLPLRVETFSFAKERGDYLVLWRNDRNRFFRRF